MNKILFLTLLAGPAHCVAQSLQSGTVYYEEVMKMEIHIDGDSAQMSQMAQFLPKEHRMNKLLHFTPEESIYVNDADQPKEKMPQQVNEEDQGGAVFRVEMDAPEEKTYTDLRTGKSIEQRDLMGRLFLVSSDGSKTDWKLTGKQKMVLNYPCQEATAVIDSSLVTVWFTPMISNPVGPMALRGLPGLILEAVLENGDFTITASKIELKSIDEALLAKPKEGKKVSEAEFHKIQLEKQKEMEQQFGTGGGNGIFIQISND